MWICAAGDLTRASAGVVDFVNTSLFWSGFNSFPYNFRMSTNYEKVAIDKFKYIKSLYIINIKSGPDCQFDSVVMLYNILKLLLFYS